MGRRERETANPRTSFYARGGKSDRAIENAMEAEEKSKTKGGEGEGKGRYGERNGDLNDGQVQGRCFNRCHLGGDEIDLRKTSGGGRKDKGGLGKVTREERGRHKKGKGGRYCAQLKGG